MPKPRIWWRIAIGPVKGLSEDEHQCALCSKLERYDQKHDHLRAYFHVRAPGGLGLGPGAFLPRLVPGEKKMLGIGENWLCTARAQCRRRAYQVRREDAYAH